ncbi:hypothetical protein CEXT_764591 [Caerostris extrusa]|uniref:Uncharacterized protein n=1 Tax=Caerostris extrusa TaxID=172846 RepID=A0AAV4Y1D5_CAEEX|nr:hypothetical protein CEXT_764591 [Caerostris extrusa]
MKGKKPNFSEYYKVSEENVSDSYRNLNSEPYLSKCFFWNPSASSEIKDQQTEMFSYKTQATATARKKKKYFIIVWRLEVSLKVLYAEVLVLNGTPSEMKYICPTH